MSAEVVKFLAMVAYATGAIFTLWLWLPTFFRLHGSPGPGGMIVPMGWPLTLPFVIWWRLRLRRRA